jgi:transcriptional regulator with XRE-family HTH domain
MASTNGPSTMPIRMPFGRACLATRLDLDISREQLAERVGVTPGYIGRIERGSANPTVALIEAIAEALGLELQLGVRPPAFPFNPYVRDTVHARCSAYADRRLRGSGWSTAREVEITHGRSHGWIDLLAFDPRTGTLLVLEVKTRLVDLGALERQLSWYERAARQEASALGWRVRRMTSVVLALASNEVDQVIRVHRDVILLAFPIRASALARGLVDPSTLEIGRGLALIDPSSRRKDWLIRTSLDGRRSPLPYVSYADAIRPAA